MRKPLFVMKSTSCEIVRRSDIWRRAIVVKKATAVAVTSTNL